MTDEQESSTRAPSTFARGGRVIADAAAAEGIDFAHLPLTEAVDLLCRELDLGLLPMDLAIAAANEAMGIEPHGSLSDQAVALLSAMGFHERRSTCSGRAGSVFRRGQRGCVTRDPPLSCDLQQQQSADPSASPPPPPQQVQMLVRTSSAAMPSAARNADNVSTAHTEMEGAVPISGNFAEMTLAQKQAHYAEVRKRIMGANDTAVTQAARCTESGRGHRKAEATPSRAAAAASSGGRASAPRGSKHRAGRR